MRRGLVKHRFQVCRQLIHWRYSRTLQSSGSPKQSFPLFCSSRPQSAGNSASRPSDRSELIVLGPKKTFRTPLVKGLQVDSVTRC